MKNEVQIKKSLLSDKTLKFPIKLHQYNYEFSKNKDRNEIRNKFSDVIYNIFSEFNKSQKTVLILGRNNYDLGMLVEFCGEMFKFKQNREKKILEIESSIFKRLDIKFLTVHRSKGLEADEIIVINNKDSLGGFPNQMLDDPILSILLSEPEEFLHAEERKLFYVALTRTKNSVHLLYPQNYSIFIKEMKEYINKNSKSVFDIKLSGDGKIELKCPICKGNLISKINSKDKKTFFSCENYPQCRFAMPNTTENFYAICPECGAYLVKRNRKFGEFYGCNSYPECTFTTENAHEYEIK